MICARCSEAVVQCGEDEWRHDIDDADDVLVGWLDRDHDPIPIREDAA